MATWTNITRNAATWTNVVRHSAAWTNASKSLGSTGALLLENGFYILQEDGLSKLLLEQSGGTGPVWTNLVKN